MVKIGFRESHRVIPPERRLPWCQGVLQLIDKMTGVQGEVFHTPTILLSGAVSGEEEVHADGEDGGTKGPTCEGKSKKDSTAAVDFFLYLLVILQMALEHCHRNDGSFPTPSAL